jgi:hypothetical protein
VAIVRELKPQAVPKKEAAHTDTECTYAIVTADDGSKLLQLDTYGSERRRIPGKVSQSIRFTEAALKQLAKIIRENFGDR